MHVASVLGVSQASISRLSKGELHPEVPWPNGSLGEMPVQDARGSTKMMWTTTAEAYHKMPEILQVRILEVVNVQRVAHDLPEIPELAPLYHKFMSSSEDDFDSIFERPPIEQAQLAEDQRICLLMDEFHKILDADLADQKLSAIMSILEATRDTREDEPPPREVRSLMYRKMEWEEVLDRGHGVDIVKKALATDDLLLQEACSIAFYELRNSSTKNWNNPNLAKQIWKIRERLQGMSERGCDSERDAV